MNVPMRLAACGSLACATLAACTAPPLAPRAEATASSARASVVDWTAVRPVADVSVHAMSAAEAPPQLRGGKGYFVVEGRIVDLKSGTALAKPRLFVRRGSEATMELGDTDRVMMKVTVLIDDKTDYVSTATEVRDGGKLIKTSTTRFAITPT